MLKIITCELDPMESLSEVKKILETFKDDIVRFEMKCIEIDDPINIMRIITKSGGRIIEVKGDKTAYKLTFEYPNNNFHM